MKIHGTAKAGALSKKDFGVAFAKSVTPCIDEDINQLLTDHEYGLSGSRYVAILINSGSALIGFKLSNVQFAMRTTSSGGTLYCRHWDSGGNVVTNYWNIAVSSVGTGAAYYGDGITTDDETAIAEGDYIGMQLSTTGSDAVDVKAKQSDVYDSTNTTLTDNGTESSGRDMTFKLTGCPNQ